ncbi:hypothetical protein LY90DRAFT_701254 [Neocallimastix californiae]|uniref:Uncharacterized protein n=1 Tax=Neocallimastix californiae TaxID=1754190 RepID=A0A1Y2DMH1_9FUNG|nr:hypothetical protein LY90DRAFT_701254 [Neocallimastix californiae]|eukprot:ORY60472.1 hypothetical protein LY90DRAFT_701254 [Neocallimastix californiae]
MSWNKVEKNSQKRKQQKQNVIIDNEDIEGIGKDSIFAALSDVDNNQKPIVTNKGNDSSNNEMKPNSSNSSLNSPKMSKKSQNVPTKTAPIQDLSKLNVVNFISKNIKINDNEQDQIDQLKKLCNFIEIEITNKLCCTTTKFSHKSFDIDSPEFEGPINYLPQKQIKEIENVFKKCKESVIKKLFILISKCILVGEKKAVSNEKFISNTIAHQICVQIISSLYPGIFYKPGKEKKIVYEQIIGNSKDSIEKLPAVGNTIVWICNQQHYKINKKEIYCPEYIGFWMEYFINALASTDASIAIKTQSVKLLNKVLDGVKENKNKIDNKVQISLDSFIAFVIILKSKNVNSQMKSLLFDNASNVLTFKVPFANMFNKIYGILSDPKYDEAVYKEFLNILVLAFGKERSLFDTWETIYKQNQPNNVKRSADIIKEIKNQQTEYFKHKKYYPENNYNDRLRNTLYTIIGKNEEFRNKSNEVQINEMNKNIRAILNKTKRSRSDDGFFKGFIMKLLRRSIILILLISFALHVIDSVDDYNTVIKVKNGTSHYELPPGHPPIKAGADFSKCPYFNFRDKYNNCNQCHPIIKYVYTSMNEPYKYVESRFVIPFYKHIWLPYCSKPYNRGLQYAFIPLYIKVKPYVSENVLEPVSKVYNTYAKEYIDKTNENVLKPATSTGIKYLGQAYTVMKPITIKTKDYVFNDVIKPSLPYVNKAKDRTIQYGNQFLGTLSEIKYKKLMKNGTSQTLRFIGRTERGMEKLYRASSPYARKYWEVLSRKTNVLMKQDAVQKVLTNQYVKTTTDTIKKAYNSWCYSVKVSYIFLTQRGPKNNNSKNWKRAIDEVSIKEDIKSSLDFTKRFFRKVIKKLEEEEKEEGGKNSKANVKTIKVDQEHKEESKLLPKNLKEKSNDDKKNNHPEPKEKENKSKRGQDQDTNTESKKTNKKNVETKDEMKDKIKKNVKKNVDSVAKQLAKEKAKIKQEVKRIVKEDFENNVSKRRLSSKDITKAKVEVTKQMVKERANEDTKQVVLEHTESSKKLAKDNAVKQIAKEEVETNKKNVEDEKAKAAAKELAKENMESTKQTVKKNAFKQLAKEKASKEIAKEKVESAKRIAKDGVVKQIVKEGAVAKELKRKNVEDTKKVIKEKANIDTKQVVKEHVEAVKQLAKEKATEN